jgi:OPA family glycerol-3-phosphate transporter-like MFS transporter
MHNELTQIQKVWRVKILTATWLSYAGFYFCRKNFAIAKSSLLESLAITSSELAHIYTAYLIAYMLGQFMMSYLGRKIATRILLLGGMGISVICNIIFGFSYLMGPAGYMPLLSFMVINGFAQATGWPGNVGILSHWLRRGERGRIMAAWATSYQLGSILAKIFASFMLGYFGAVWSFWGASAVLFGVWIVFFIIERDTPEEIGIDPIVQEIDIEIPISERNKYSSEWSTQVIFSIFFMGAVYFVFKFLRYSLDSWSPMAVELMFQQSKANAGYISTLFDWVGFGGVLFAGWISDKHFLGRRHQTIFFMTCGMLVAFILMAFIGVQSLIGFSICLSLCGFMLMGPDSLIAGVGGIDVGGRKMAIVAAGVINGLGSIGPIFQEEIIGYFLDQYGFQSTFYMMIGICVLGIIGTGYLSIRSRRGHSNL